MKKLLINILKLDKQMEKHEKTLEKIEKHLETRLVRIDKQFENFKALEKHFGTVHNPYDLVLELSPEFPKYYTEKITIVNEDIKFDEALKNLLIQDEMITIRLNAFNELMIAIELSDGSIDKGLLATEELIQAASTENPDTKAATAQTIEAISKELGDLKSKRQISAYLRKVIKDIKIKSDKISKEIDQLINVEHQYIQRITTDNAKFSKNLGSYIGTYAQHDTDTTKEALNAVNNLEKDMNVQNRVAGEAMGNFKNI